MKDQYALIHYCRIAKSELPGLYKVEVLPSTAPEEALGNAVLRALEIRPMLTHAKLQRAVESIRKSDPAAYAIYDKCYDSFNSVYVEFDGIWEREKLSFEPRKARAHSLGKKTKLSVASKAVTIATTVKRLINGMGPLPKLPPLPPLQDLFRDREYRALIVGGTGTDGAIEDLKKRKLTEWSEDKRNGPRAARLTAAALGHDPTALLDELRALSQIHEVEIAYAFATRSTDCLLYANFDRGKCVRLLIHGLHKEREWSVVRGTPQAWEREAFGDVPASKRTKVIVAYAMSCIDAALKFAYLNLGRAKRK